MWLEPGTGNLLAGHFHKGLPLGAGAKKGSSGSSLREEGQTQTQQAEEVALEEDSQAGAAEGGGLES